MLQIHGNEPVKKNIKESKAMPAPDASVELQASIQVTELILFVGSSKVFALC